MSRFGTGLFLLISMLSNLNADDKPAHVEALKAPRKNVEILRIFEKSNVETFIVRDTKGQVPELMLLEGSSLARIMNHNNGTSENGSSFKIEFRGIRLIKIMEAGSKDARVEMRLMGKAKESVGSKSISLKDLEDGKKIRIKFPKYEKNKLGTQVVIDGDMSFRWDQAKQQLQIERVCGNLEIDSRIYGQKSCPGELTNILGVRGKLEPLPMLD